MKIQSFAQPVVTAAPVSQAPVAPQAPAAPADTVETSATQEKSVNWKKLGGVALAAAIPAAAGVYAGLSTGTLAGISGMVAAAPALSLLGVVGGAYVGENIFHKSDGEQLGWVFAGGLGGLAAGAVGGYLVGASCSHPALAIGLGLLGAGAGAFNGILRS